MKKNKKLNNNVEQWLFDQWDKRRQEEEKTIGAKRTLTEKEIDRAMVIGRWFTRWNEKTGECPIDLLHGHWGKKLCSLFEWISVLETKTNKYKK